MEYVARNEGSNFQPGGPKIAGTWIWPVD